MAPDGKLYNGRNGELFELRQGLNSNVAKERKTALKRTVAAMTLGKDVSSLFTDVIKNTASDLAMKKLVYLYIINYAKSNPELALLVINTFIKDAADPHPLIRALAVRTMALIPLENVTEYLCDPLRAALADSDPYVQKTAAIAVAKLYDTNPNVVRDEGFIGDLQKLLSANNPMTVANAVAALAEIASVSDDPSVFEVSSSTVPRFLASLSECTEWGQVFILDAVCHYQPSSSDEADMMVERVVPRLQHSNSSVVLSAVRFIFGLLPFLDSDAKRNFLAKKISPPLLSLMTAPPELQFVALRNLSLLAESRPEMLNADVKMFFVSYSDPLYVKVEKLDILVRLSNPANSEIILAELKEYTGEVDVAFVRRAVACIGRISVKQPTIADRGVSLFMELLERRIPHIVEEVSVALADVLRAYPGRFEVAISALCEASSVIDDPVARTALVWIIGEHAGNVPGVITVLTEILETLPEEGPEVQLQILSACFKALILCGSEAESIFRRCCEYATVECVNIDVRERGFLYLRLAEANRDDVRKVVLAKKPGINAESHNLNSELLQELLSVLGTLAAVFHKPASEFDGVREHVRGYVPNSGIAQEEDLLGLDANGRELPPIPDVMPGGSISAASNLNGKASLNSSSLFDGLFGDNETSIGLTSTTQDVQPGKLVSSDGLLVTGDLTNDDQEKPAWSLMFENQSSVPMSNFGMLLGNNAFGLAISQPLSIPSSLEPHRAVPVMMSMNSGKEADLTKGTTFKIAVKFTSGPNEKVVSWECDVGDKMETMLLAEGPMSKGQFLSTWQSLPDSTETVAEVAMAPAFATNFEATKEVLRKNKIYTVAKRTVDGRKVIYMSAKLQGPWECGVLSELTMPKQGVASVAKLASRCMLGASGKPFLDSFNATVARILDGR